MSSDLPISYVEISVIAHATEDLAKVIAAATNLFSVDHRDKIVFSQTALTGYHGNPITRLEAEIKDKDTVKDLIRNLAENLNSLNKEAFASEFDRFVDKGNLFLRFNKQRAFGGNVEFGQTDPIRIRIHFRSASLQQIAESLKSSGLLI